MTRLDQLIWEARKRQMNRDQEREKAEQDAIRVIINRERQQFVTELERDLSHDIAALCGLDYNRTNGKWQALMVRNDVEITISINAPYRFWELRSDTKMHRVQTAYKDEALPKGWTREEVRDRLLIAIAELSALPTAQEEEDSE